MGAHEVVNQPPPRVGLNEFTDNIPLVEGSVVMVLLGRWKN